MILQSPKWLTHERQIWIASLGFTAVVFFAIGNGHTTENSIHAISDNLGHCLYDRQHLTTAPAASK